MALLCGGGYAEYVSVPEELLMRVPPHLSFSDAAAVPEAWLTAFQLLDFIGTGKKNNGEALKLPTIEAIIGLSLWSLQVLPVVI